MNVHVRLHENAEGLRHENSTILTRSAPNVIDRLAAADHRVIDAKPAQLAIAKARPQQGFDDQAIATRQCEGPFPRPFGRPPHVRQKGSISSSERNIARVISHGGRKSFC